MKKLYITMYHYVRELKKADIRKLKDWNMNILSGR